MRIQLITWLLLICAFASSAAATSIVILRSANNVYIGADSRRSYREPGESFSGEVCKIVPAGRFIFVASGLTYANRQQVADIGADAGRNSSSVRMAIETFRNRIASFLPSALTSRDQIEGPTGNALVLEAAFVGMDRGIAQVSMEWFRTAGNSPHRDVTSDRRTYASSRAGRYDFLFLGKRHAIDQSLQGHYPTIRGDLDAIQVINRLIGDEIRDSPESTAPPIDILQISATGARWLQRKPGCSGGP